VREASIDDIPLLVRLMDDFYAEAGYTLDQAHATQAFATILTDKRLGSIWLIQARQTEGRQIDVGYLVLTLKYAMEYGGLVACVDDLFVQTAWRNRGLSTASLSQLLGICGKAGIRAITVETGFNNGPAQKVYRRVGFIEMGNRQLLVLPLASPTHVTPSRQLDTI
jgi:GNAT superfamily N-acetyltransferase